MTQQNQQLAPATPLAQARQLSIPGIVTFNSDEILGPDSRLAWLLWAASGYGKTKLAGGLDALTQKYRGGKRTLYLPIEPGEGGGAASIRKLGIPMCVPKDYNDLYRILGLLRNNKEIGGIVVDSGSELAKQYVKPAALKYPSRENSPTRSAGIPARSDYQVMGELMSQVLRALIAMTTHENPDYRKDLIVTATDVTKEEDERITFIGPDLPGRMAREAVQMFQQVGTIGIRTAVLDGKRVAQRYLTFQADGVKALKDRYEIYPPEMALRAPGSEVGEDLVSIFEKYWQPAIAG